MQRAEALTQTKGGIVIPEKAQAKVLEGVVIAVGPGARNSVSIQFTSTRCACRMHPIDVKLIPIFRTFLFWLQEGKHVELSVKPGDKVLLPEFGGTKVDLQDDNQYTLFRETDILAKVE